MNNPLVSVLVPSFNYARYLTAALDSLLKQTYTHFEIIVVDDGSDDNSMEILKTYESKFPGIFRVSTHEGHKRRGIIKTYQKALSESRGELIAFLEADDLWESANLAEKVEAFLNYPQVGVVYSAYKPFGMRRGAFYWNLHAFVNHFFLARNQPTSMLKALLRSNPVSSFSHFMVKRSLFEQIPVPHLMGGYYDWWALAHLSLVASFYFIPEKLCRWRIHSLSAGHGRISRRKIFRLHVFLKQLHKSLKRNAMAQDKIETIEKYSHFQTLVADREASAVFKKVFFHPLESLRFAGHLFLRNLLFFQLRAE